MVNKNLVICQTSCYINRHFANNFSHGMCLLHNRHCYHTIIYILVMSLCVRQRGAGRLEALSVPWSLNVWTLRYVVDVSCSIK